jgi:glycosyltransferase involved in cell wall biosynthesis
MQAISISVIIPFFNAGPYLRRCLDSVFRQEMTDIEIICVNDGSTDDSLEIAEEYAARFRNMKIITQENRGLSNARNRGMEAACGEYIIFADADDHFEPRVMGSLLSLCREHGLDMLDFRVTVVTGEISRRMYPEMTATTGVSAGRAYFTEFIRRHGKQPFLSAWSHMYRREFLEKNRFSFIDGRKYEDLVFTANAYLAAGAVMYTDIAVYNYIQVRGSITTSGISPAHISDIQFMALETGRLSEASGIRIPMDTYFSGIRNQVITAMVTGKWKEYRALFDRQLFGKTEFCLYRPSFRVVYPLVRKNYSLFIFYCRLTLILKQLRRKSGLMKNIH